LREIFRASLVDVRHGDGDDAQLGGVLGGQDLLALRVRREAGQQVGLVSAQPVPLA